MRVKNTDLQEGASLPRAVSEMERVTLIALLCVLFSTHKKVSGAEVEVRVRPGDDLILYCNCVIPTGSYIIWFRNCSHENQPPFALTTMDAMRLTITRFSFVENSTSKSFDLSIKNVSETDLGLYYCARTDQEVTTGNGMIVPQTKMQYGNWSTRLSLIEEEHTCPTAIPNVTWQLLVIVATMVALVSSVLSAVCVYCLCRKRTREADQAGSHHEARDLEVCYASLDVKNLSNIQKKKKSIQHSDFSTYSEVRA